MAGTSTMGLRAAKKRKNPTRVSVDKKTGVVKTKPGTGFLRSALKGDVRRKQMEKLGL